MTPQETRQEALESIFGLLLHNEFTFEIKVKAKPGPIRVIYECSQEEMDCYSNHIIDLATNKF